MLGATGPWGGSGTGEGCPSSPCPLEGSLLGMRPEVGDADEPSADDGCIFCGATGCSSLPLAGAAALLLGTSLAEGLFPDAPFSAAGAAAAATAAAPAALEGLPPAPAGAGLAAEGGLAPPSGETLRLFRNFKRYGSSSSRRRSRSRKPPNTETPMTAPTSSLLAIPPSDAGFDGDGEIEGVGDGDTVGEEDSVGDDETVGDGDGLVEGDRDGVIEGDCDGVGVVDRDS